jgi:hypothetical protein
MTLPPFALEAPTTDVIGQWVLRILAVAGGAAVGGFAVGLITQGLSRLLTTRPVPRVPLLIVRLLGAVVCGWIVFKLVFGSGLFGLGGGGGLWPFGGSGGSGAGTGKESPPAASGRAGETGRDSGKSAPGGATLVVEVLPEYPALYRVRTPGGPRTFKFDELTEYLLVQKKATPPLTGIEVSEESSDPNAPAVRRLTEWARQNGLSAVTPPHPAP